MPLVDSSIWIELLRSGASYRLKPESIGSIAVCPPVIQEVLAGIRDDLFHRKIRESLVSMNRIGDPIALDTHLHAADIFRLGRRKGLTIRSSTDCLIAAIAMRHDYAVWHKDRDFEAIARFTQLRTIIAKEL